VNAATTLQAATRQEFLRDVATTAVEGGIGYWSCATHYRWTTDGSGDLDKQLPFPEVRIIPAESPEDFDGELAPGVTGTRFVEKGRYLGLEITLTADMLERGLAMFADASKDIDLNAKSRKEVIGAATLNDACDIDADLADYIVQVSVFGKVVFG
jgi:hypothetical protein